MATRNIVPRANGEGGLGTSAKHWGNIYADNGTIAGRNIANDGAMLATHETEITNLQSQVTTLEHAYAGAKAAATVADMTDHNQIYVYVGSETGYTNGNWYYWNGTAWTSGGVYNATALETDKTLTVSGAAADAATVGSKILVKTFTGSDINDTSLTYQGVWSIPAGVTINNMPDSSTSGWLLNVYDNLFMGNGYSTQILSNQDGIEYQRWTDHGNNRSQWHRIDNYTKLFTGNDLNDVSLASQGNWIIPANAEINNTPIPTHTGGWLLQTQQNLFTGNQYSLQTLIAQNGETFTRYTNGNGSISRWNRQDSKPIVFTGNNINDVSLTYQGVWSIPAGVTINNMPDSSTSGWLLMVYDGLFVNGNYAIQILTNQNADTYQRWTDHSGKNQGSWIKTNNSASITGKINWVAFGDSITAGQLRAGAYLDFTSEIIGANYTNKGVGATGFIGNPGTNPCLYYVKKTDFTDYDLCTIAYGINDYLANVPLGDENSASGDSNVCGQLIASIEYINQKYPATKVVILTPLNITIRGDINSNYALNTKNTQNYTLLELIEKIIKVCDKYNVPYVEMHKEIGWSRFNLNSKLGDGLHPEEQGYRDFARTLSACLPYKK